MTREEAIKIYNEETYVRGKRLVSNPLPFTRFRQCNAYIADETMEVLGHTIRLIKSYQTIVGYADYTTNTFVEIGRWSRTTSKQCTQIYNTYFKNMERMNCMHYVTNW